MRDRVVVGCDGSTEAAAAVRWAAAETRLRGWTLEVVHGLHRALIGSVSSGVLHHPRGRVHLSVW